MPSVPVDANNGLIVFSRQIGKVPPVVGSWIPICADPLILFDECYVVFDGPIPETRILTAPGHRLKELIDTGILSHSLGERAPVRRHVDLWRAGQA